MKKRLLAAGMAAFLLTSCSSLFEPIGESSGSSGSESSAAESSGTEEQNAPLLSFRIQDETFIVNTAGKEIRLNGTKTDGSSSIGLLPPFMTGMGRKFSRKRKEI